MKVRDCMTKSPHTVGADQNIHTAKRMMAELGVRHLPVLDGGHFIGILSDRDIKLALAVDKTEESALKVSHVCVTEAITVSPDDSVKEVSALMARDGIGSVIVLEKEKVTGIFTTTDACRTLADVL